MPEIEFLQNFIEFLGISSKFMTTSAKFWTLQAYKSHTMCIKMLQKPGLLFLAASSFGTTVYALGPLQNILHLRDGCRNWQSNIESPYLVGGVEAFFLQAVKSMIKCDFLDACKFQSPKAPANLFARLVWLSGSMFPNNLQAWSIWQRACRQTHYYVALSFICDNP